MRTEVQSPKRQARKLEAKGQRTAGHRSWGTGRAVVVACFPIIVGFAASAPAQDSLQLSLQNVSAAETRQRQLLKDQPYTVRWGEMNVLAGFSMAGGWNDNVNLSHSDPREDFFILPLGNLNLFWPVTDVNALTFSIGVGYEKFFRHDEYDQLWVMPGSLLGWDVVIKDFKLNFHDFVSFEQDPTSAGAVSGLGRFGSLDNTAGLVASWDLHDVALSVGYDHENAFYSPSSYEYLNHSSDFGFLRASLQVHPAAKAGLEAAGGPTGYARRPVRDNVTYSLGAFGDWEATEHLRVQARGGYYDYDFYNQAPAAASPDQDGYYFSLRLTHDLRQDLSYSLTVGRQAYFGVYSPLTEEWYGKATMNWRVNEYLAVSAGFKYERATQPIVAEFSDDYDRMSATLRVSCPIKERLIASVDYQYWLKDDEVTSSRDYQQNRVTLELTYRF